jgi:hypothetical protein
MRSLKAAFGAAAIFLLFTPVSAQAWWGWLDDLSGPGKFRGPQFNVRIVCFGEESEAKRLVDGLKNANAVTAKLPLGKPGLTPVRKADVAAMADAWHELLASVNGVQLTFPVLNAQSVKETIEQISRDIDANLKMATRTTSNAQKEAIANDDYVDIDLDNMRALVRKWNGDLEPLISEVVRGISSISSTGVFLSACSTDTKRRSSIELDTNFWYADKAQGFAGQQQIRLTTLMPEFSFRVFTDPRFDFLDAGIGAGVYWFTSTGFPSFSGVVLQPARLDFHAPTLWSTYPSKSSSDRKRNATTEVLRRIAAVPTFRFSVMEFPGGFAPDAFAGTGEHHVQIPGELIKSWSLFLNLEPFVRRAPFITKAK